MFETLRNGHKLGAMASKWVDCTGLDPGDRGQIAKMASNLVANSVAQPEDAWLTALLKWMNGMPWPEDKVNVAQALIHFLDTYEGKIALSANTIIVARLCAQQIIDDDYSEGSDPEDILLLLNDPDAGL